MYVHVTQDLFPYLPGAVAGSLPAWLCSPRGKGPDGCSRAAGADKTVEAALKASLSPAIGIAALWQLLSGSFGLLRPRSELELALKFSVRRRCLCSPSPSLSAGLRLLPLPASSDRLHPCSNAAGSFQKRVCCAEARTMSLMQQAFL